MRIYCTHFCKAVVLLIVTLCTSSAFAQSRIVGAISGSVVDPSGAAVPGAKVVLRDEATGIKKEVTSDSQGSFLLPDLAHGAYEITVTAQGFETSIAAHIAVDTSRTTDVVVHLKVGQVSEKVTVEGEAVALELTSNLISKTTTSETIHELPILNRTALPLLRLVPGQSTAFNSNVGQGDTHWNNMPGGATNVTLDGINNASNGFKSGGTVYYFTVPVRLGAVDEVAVETSGLGADSAGMSGANLKFVTRRGTSQYHGEAFYQPTSEIFNANTWLRNAQGQDSRVYNRNHNFGGSFGGKLLPFGRFKEKAFFFVNYEYVYNPQFVSKTQTVLQTAAQTGTFTYRATDNSIRTANVLNIAAANGFPSAISPAMGYIIGKQQASLSGGYVTPINNNFNQQTLNWTDPNPLKEYDPATRLDYYITPNLQFSGTWSIRHTFQPGTRQFPLPDFKPVDPFRIAGYFVYSTALNWTVSPRTFNEFRYGVQHSGDTNEIEGYQIYNTYNDKVFRVAPPLIATLRPDRNNTTGRHYITTVYDTVTMNRGAHSLSAGGTYRRTDWHDTTEAINYPRFAIGAPGSDPAAAIFNTTSLPGVNASDIGTAQSLYYLLTGRVSGVTYQAFVDPATQKYGGVFNTTWTRSHMGGFFVQDRWRLRPNLTLNAGLRLEFQGDMFNVDGIAAIPNESGIFGPSKALFQPGALGGNLDPVLTVGSHAFQPDWFNVAPNVGFAWNPKKDSGWLGKLLGGKTVIRGHYGLIYYDEGTQFFAQGVGSGGQPGGKSQNSSFTPGQAGVPFGLTVDNLLNGNLPAYTTVSPTAFVSTVHESDTAFSSTLNGMKPTLRTPYVISWNFGIQRELRQGLLLEVNYVANHSHHAWRTFNLNEVNIFENGFLQEFVNAQNNLKVNAANGTANNFANLGFAGDKALPIFEAAFGARGAVAALPTASGFGNSAYITNLTQGAAGSLANSLGTNAQTFCRMTGSNFTPCARIGNFNASGPYPINFFFLNPYGIGSGSATFNYTDDVGWTSYNGLQTTLRKRTTHGLTMQVNYTFSKGLGNERVDNANQGGDYTTLRNLGLDKSPSAFDIRHVFQFISSYDLPVGRGKRFATNSGRLLNTMIGGWMLGSIINLQSGSPIPITGGFSTVNVNGGPVGHGATLAPGVTLDQIQSLLVNSQGPSTNRYSVDTRLIGSDGRASTQYFVTPSTPGQYGQFLYLYGKNYWQWDASLVKNTKITERLNLNLWLGITNVFNHPEWGVTTTMNVQSTTFGQVTNPMNGARSVQARGILRF